MSSLFYFSSAGEDELSSCAPFSAAPSQSLSYILFTPGSHWVQPQYYAVGTERLHLEQLGIKHFPQEQLTGKMKEESSFSPHIPWFSLSPERFETVTDFSWACSLCVSLFDSICFITIFVFLGESVERLQKDNWVLTFELVQAEKCYLPETDSRLGSRQAFSLL